MRASLHVVALVIGLVGHACVLPEASPEERLGPWVDAGMPYDASTRDGGMPNVEGRGCACPPAYGDTQGVASVLGAGLVLVMGLVVSTRMRRRHRRRR